MASAELEFEAPLARFDVDEWTEFHSTSQRDEESFRSCRYDDEPVDEPRRVRTPSEMGSSGSSNLAENFNETFSGSLEDLVNTFDQRVTKCCRNYSEEVEELAPVQMRTDDEVHSNSCQTWYTLTGTFGNLPPINWSQFDSRLCRPPVKKHQAKGASLLGLPEHDIEDEEELLCSIEDVDEYGSDILEVSGDAKLDDEESLDALDNADDVINELESLLEDRDELDSAVMSPLMHISSSAMLNGPDVAPQDSGVWFEESVKKLSLDALTQLSADLACAIIDHNGALRSELTLNEQLKLENQLSRDFIALTLSIEQKQKQILHHCELSDEEDNIDEMGQSDAGTYLSTVIPYRPSDGKPSIQRLQIYLNLLSAINEDSSSVPRLLTDYILNVLCPAN